MPDFSVIVQNPAVRAVVQERVLERAFHDALFPNSFFRGEATPFATEAGVGENRTFTAKGLMQPRLRPSVPGQDPTPDTYMLEQWSIQMQQYGGTIDVHVPSAQVAIVDLFLQNVHELGLQAGQSLNRLVRNKLFGAALSGWTVVDGAHSSTTTLRVKRLNGFTTARRPDLAAGSQVAYNPVSSSNPLQIVINGAANTVVGFTPDNVGDEVGPGTLTLGSAATASDGHYVKAVDATTIVRSGGGNSVRDLTATTDIPTLADIRNVIAQFRSQNAPMHPDGLIHAHIDPVSENLLFADAEMQRLNTSLPDYYMYKEFAVGKILNTAMLRNNENPLPETVYNGTTGAFSMDDPFPGEVYNTGVNTGTRVHRILFTAQDCCREYWMDTQKWITAAGITGAMAEPSITNNGIEINTDRIAFIFRAPIDRNQEMVAATWKFVGDWAMRTDGATGSASRYKRTIAIEHAE